MPKKREKKKRQPNKRILILCEGEKTESCPVDIRPATVWHPLHLRSD